MVKKAAAKTEMRSSVRASLDAAIAAGTEPKQNKRQSGRLMLSLGGKQYATLADANGKLTVNGQYYFKTARKEPPKNGFAADTPIIKKGPADYIRMLDGTEKMVRRYNPAKSDFTYSALGKQYYAKEREELMVAIPVRIQGTNKKN